MRPMPRGSLLPACRRWRSTIARLSITRTNKLGYTNVGFQLLPPKFTLTQLQLVHEAILGESPDKRNFRRKIAQQGIVKPVDEWAQTGRRPAQLFRFSET